MATIHPRSKMLRLRDDGDGGLDLTVTTSNGVFEVTPLSLAEASLWITQLGDFIRRTVVADGEAKVRMIGKGAVE